jgi:16S rRNA (guanine(1405)-N(7))-methyltransferase
MALDLAAAAAQVKGSRKYRHLCDETVQRVVRWAADRSRTQKELVARARRKLHQVYGAYLSGWDAGRAGELLDALVPGSPADRVRAVCREVMALHASTRERLPLLDALYGEIFAVTGVPRRVLDLGCGLHPFALPWMGLAADADYTAWEIDETIVELASRFLPARSRQSRAVCRDVLASRPADPADLVFLLKMLPCLEQQEKGSGTRLLRALSAPFVVVSFPNESLGGRSKGMPAHYAAVMEELASGLGGGLVRIEHEPETFYVLCRD